ncbi:MAG: hypothetical protein CMH49_03370 [Myxococcales bacterium]|nr:hypothetical protein [Myxococcales bacterium]
MSTISKDLTLELKTAVLVVAGEPWQVKQFNQTAQSWFGESLQEGVLLSTVIVGINEQGLRRRLNKGRATEFDYTVQLDRELPVEFICSKTESYEGGVILEGRDLTRVHSSELMLASYSKMIEEKTSELEAAIQARDQFFSTMSHELRTPLNSIIGFTEALIDEIYGEFTDEQLTILKKVYHSGQNLMSLLTNLLYLSRIKSGKLHLSLVKTDLAQVCEKAIFNLEERCEAKRIKILVDSQATQDYHPQVDPQLCEQMIRLLLDNAIKFSPEASTIQVMVQRHLNVLRVTVSDSGIGIARENFNQIFQPFTQVETSLARVYEGSGLGLSVVSEVIRLHGGQVSVESTLGQGSKFHLDFVCDK